MKLETIVVNLSALFLLIAVKRGWITRQNLSWPIVWAPVWFPTVVALLVSVYQKV